MTEVVSNTEIEKKVVFGVPEIKWSEDFHDLEPEHQVRYLKKLTSSLNHALMLMQDERNECLKNIETLKKQIENVENNLMTQKNIVGKVIHDRNDLEQKYLKEISGLKKKIIESK